MACTRCWVSGNFAIVVWRNHLKRTVYILNQLPKLAQIARVLVKTRTIRLRRIEAN